uniref:Putative tryptophan synthase beta subunit-like PLP-dependent enzyme n=1 Tax=Helianthus annuus TaxID=4232 RepID=A0A251UYC2_HELAN
MTPELLLFLILLCLYHKGTLSLKFLDQVPQLDAEIVVGGLISCMVIGAKSKNPAIWVLAAEPKGADDATQFKAYAKMITLSQTNTIDDRL